MKIALVQPRYPHGKAQIYLPGGLMNLGSRLLTAGLEVELFDMNLAHSPLYPESFDVIGFSVLGPPYIPAVISAVRRLRAYTYTGKLKIIVGGEGVARLTKG